MVATVKCTKLRMKGGRIKIEGEIERICLCRENKYLMDTFTHNLMVNGSIECLSFNEIKLFGIKMSR